MIKYNKGDILKVGEVSMGMWFSRDMIILLIVIITFIPSLIFFLSRIFKYKDDKEKKNMQHFWQYSMLFIFQSPLRR